MHAVQLAVGLALEESVTLSEAVREFSVPWCETAGLDIGCPMARRST